MKTKTIIGLSILSVAGLVLLNSCASIPKGAVPVKPFDIKRYLGTWYEIARKDFRFERDLNNTTATYTINKDGSIKVDNRGFNYKKNRWEEAIGKAKFKRSPQVARLKVSFYGPFYSGYNVIALDEDYQYALVAGKNLKYLWILSRQATIPNEVKERYLKIARNIGYTTNDLIWVEHNQP